MGPRIAFLTAFIFLQSPSMAAELGTLRIEWDNAYSCHTSESRHHGYATGPSIAMDLSETFGLRARLMHHMYSSAGPDFSAQEVAAGLIIRLDVFRYVPWMELGASVRRSKPGQILQSQTGGAALGFGVDRLIDRTWSYGVFTYLQKLANVESMPAVTIVGFRVGYRFALGDPF